MRYSVVSYLDPELTAEVRSIQEKLGELTSAKASLELWLPHITVGDGIEINDSELETLKPVLNAIAADAKPFTVDMNDIIKMDSRKGGEGETTTPYGLYLDVKKNETLMNLVNAIANATEKTPKWYHMPIPYHPHCALAFKDLTKEGFEIGSKYLDDHNFSLITKIDHVALVEMLPNTTREFHRFNFGYQL